MHILFIIQMLLLFCAALESKVLIITHVYNKPEFIDYHCLTFAKFLQDDYEYVVFNDARPGEMYHKIRDKCAEWQVRCIDIPQELHNHPNNPPFNEPSWEGTLRHVDGILYSMRELGFKHKGPVMLIDSDLFLLRPFSVEQLLQKADIAAVMRHAWAGSKDVVHLWPGLTMMAMERLPRKETLDFRNGVVNGHIVDSGGNTYHYLKKNRPRLHPLGIHTDIQVKWLNQGASSGIKILNYQKAGYTPTEIRWLLKYPDPDMELFYRGHFIHVKAGRMDDPNTHYKMECVKELLTAVLSE